MDIQKEETTSWELFTNQIRLAIHFWGGSGLLAPLPPLYFSSLDTLDWHGRYIIYIKSIKYDHVNLAAPASPVHRATAARNC